MFRARKRRTAFGIEFSSLFGFGFWIFLFFFENSYSHTNKEEKINNMFLFDLHEEFRDGRGVGEQKTGDK